MVTSRTCFTLGCGRCRASAPFRVHAHAAPAECWRIPPTIQRSVMVILPRRRSLPWARTAFRLIVSAIGAGRPCCVNNKGCDQRFHVLRLARAGMSAIVFFAAVVSSSAIFVSSIAAVISFQLQICCAGASLPKGFAKATLHLSGVSALLQRAVRARSASVKRRRPSPLPSLTGAPQARRLGDGRPARTSAQLRPEPVVMRSGSNTLGRRSAPSSNTAGSVCCPDQGFLLVTLFVHQ